MSLILDDFLKFSKRLKLFTLILICITITSLKYNLNGFNMVNVKNPIKVSEEDGWDATNVPKPGNRFVLNINGCLIPKLRYMSTSARGKLADCGTRQIFLKKISDNTAMFDYRANITNCCYRFVERSKKPQFEDTEVLLTNCNPCENGTIFNVSAEVIQIKCTDYKDLYTFVIKKKLPPKIPSTNGTHWNVIVLGIDSFSRVRSLIDLNKTTRYMRKKRWLDFRGYNKIADNTYPNLIPMITNYSDWDFSEECYQLKDNCNNLFIWNRFKESGYTTSFVEDAAFMNVFNIAYGMKKPPADHFIKPLFLEAEKGVSNLDNRPVTCAGKMTEGEQVLNYVSDFVNNYKDSMFFGFFWLNTFSHGMIQSMKILDQKFLDAIKYLSKISKNTFIFLVSDHGKRYGNVMIPIESYYDSRLPAFYMMVPKDFIAKYPEKYSALRTNQKRLISSPDIHLTLNNILSLSTSSGEASPDNYLHYYCRKCKSLLTEISENRKCFEAGIPEEYCACHDIEEGWISEVHSKNVQISAEKDMENQIKTTEFKSKNQYCLKMKIFEVFRVHRYSHDGYLFYILGLKFSPTVYNEDDDFLFESIAKVYDDQNVKILSHSSLNPVGQNRHNYCCKKFWQCYYCICRTK